ncbi:sulfotransferase [Panacibacter ginsenosidivorans]|uniref:Sulfotransferase n=1 Tax=Panacibacter ginsenosidivorans TaxID=1813871 RepID=A0A5B8VDH7_9BACT|nr:sulfotransferase [Panacibacter ginsenosidivorans]QEC69587.1 sulfotransferase [Panacibacter ginsenosidivorans]
MKNISRPVIIIGSGRSGTTIISEILFRHEDLAWPSNYQEKFPSRPGVNLLRNLFDNKLWRLQGQKPQLNKVSKFNKVLFKPAEAYKFWEYLTGPAIDFSRGFLINERPTEKDVKRIHKAFGRMLHYQFKKRLAFKITGPARIGYLKAVFPDAIFINIVREPMATINSWLNVDFWQDKGKHQLWWTGAYTPQEMEWAEKNTDKPELLAAMQYRKLMEITEKEIAMNKANCLTIHYEDFVADPSAVINNILAFAELDKSTLVDTYLQGIKIYNQNKNEAPGKQVPYASEMQRILQGRYAF